jgi:hypothetical protein
MHTKVTSWPLPRCWLALLCFARRVAARHATTRRPQPGCVYSQEPGGPHFQNYRSACDTLDLVLDLANSPTTRHGGWLAGTGEGARPATELVSYHDTATSAPHQLDT